MQKKAFKRALTKAQCCISSGKIRRLGQMHQLDAHQCKCSSFRQGNLKCLGMRCRGHDQHHTSIDGLPDGTKPSFLLEIYAILRLCNSVIARVIGAGDVGVAIDGVHCLDDRLQHLAMAR